MFIDFFTLNKFYNYIQLLNSRLSEIIKKINDLVIEELKLDEIDDFTLNNIDLVFQKLKNNNIITRLNNQGRRPEEVYFSWMRGFVISTYFFKAISKIFDIDISKIKTIGDDDLESIETFKRTPKADLEICLKTKEVIRIEVQSGFQGINDIKQHKVQEAKRSKFENNISTFVIHFDLFNGQVAFVKIDEIEDNNVNWITRQQMEGQTVFNIDQNYFIWKLTEKPPMLTELSFY